MDAPTPAPRLRGALAATLLSAALVADQLRLAIEGRTAEVAHLLQLPPLPLWIGAAAMVLIALAIGVWGARAKRDVRYPRVPLLALVMVLFFYVLATNPVRPLAGKEDGAISVQAFAQQVHDLAESEGHLPTTAEQLESALAALPEPPYLVRGAPVTRWKIDVRRGCKGPALEVKSAPVGTFIYCLGDDASRVWITAVGRVTSTFGPPEVLTWQGRPASVEVDAPK